MKVFKYLSEYILNGDRLQLGVVLGTGKLK